MDNASFVVAPETSPEREAFYAKLAQKNTTAVWQVLNRLVVPEPRTSCVPVMWRYDDVRPLLMEAGGVISAREAERIALVLENPGIPGSLQITQSLYAGLQLVLPGEVAPTHRHTAAALRFVIEGTGAYTSVDGERTTMHPGDFVLTPSWAYHDHGNPGDTPVVWLDGIDLPIVNMFDTSFAEHYPGSEVQPVARPEGDTEVRYGANLLPVDYAAGDPAAQVFKYPYARSREALDRLSKSGPLHPCHGVKMQYVNPATGASPMRCITGFLQWLPAGFHGRPYRATDATVYCAHEGRGRSRVGNAVFEWGPHDVFVVPSWHTVVHETDTEAVLFSFSDRAAQKALSLWREEALPVLPE